MAKNKPIVKIGYTGVIYVPLSVPRRVSSRAYYLDFDSIVYDFPLTLFDIKIVNYHLRTPEICPF